MKRPLTVRLTAHSHKQLRELAKATEASQAEVIAIALDRYYRQIGKEKLQ